MLRRTKYCAIFGPAGILEKS